MIEIITVRSQQREELINITPQILQLVKDKNINSGKITLFVPHTTAAITINENADPDVPRDIILGLKRISPVLGEFRHTEGNSDAHIKSSLIGCSQDILVEEGRLVLGTWQGIFFCEFDGGRTRKVYCYLER